jgi:hypothetical protein
MKYLAGLLVVGGLTMALPANAQTDFSPRKPATVMERCVAAAQASAKTLPSSVFMSTAPTEACKCASSVLTPRDFDVVVHALDIKTSEDSNELKDYKFFALQRVFLGDVASPNLLSLNTGAEAINDVLRAECKWSVQPLFARGGNGSATSPRSAPRLQIE